MKNIAYAGALAALIGAGLLLGGGQGGLAPLLPEGRPAAHTVGAFGTAMIVALFAYNGWWYSTFVAGELRDPRRHIPRSIFRGMGIVLVVYVLANIVYLTVLPFDALQASTRPAADAMQLLIGPAGAGLISAAVMLSAFGTVNAQLLSVPRVYFAMARDGLFLRNAARVHPRYGTPAIAIVAQGLWSAVLVLTGSFSQLIEYTGFAVVLFSGVAGLALFVLRRRRPSDERPFRAWGYPVAPALFVVASALIVGNAIWRNPGPSGAGMLIIVAGLPLYWWVTRRG